MGDWGASPSPVEQPVPDPVGEGSRRPGEEPREGGCGLGEARNGGRGGVLTGPGVLPASPCSMDGMERIRPPSRRLGDRHLCGRGAPGSHGAGGLSLQ